MTSPTPKVLTEADLAGLPRAVSLPERAADKISKGILTGIDWPLTQDELDRLSAASWIRTLVSERDALAGRVAELEANAARYLQLLNQAREALAVYQGFIDDAHILEGQWHWLDDAKPAAAAIDAALSTTPESKP